tara:strand:+ start:148 stop:360 length:213 start_codon:yes stop_codon:yes gene_type:complete
MVKYYTVKVKIPCVTYKDVYVEASSKSKAKEIAKEWVKDGDCDGVYDFSGDYDFEQMCDKGVVQTVTEGK